MYSFMFFGLLPEWFYVLCIFIPPAGEMVAAFMSGMSSQAGSSGAVTASPSHGGGKGTIVLQDSPHLTTKVTEQLM